MASAAQVFDVTCPEGAQEGCSVSVRAPGGVCFEVIVPVGVQPGQTFAVEVEHGGAGSSAEASGTSSAASSDAGNREMEIPSMEGAIQTGLQTGQIQRREADALRSLLKSLYKCSALDDFVSRHCAALAEYSRDGEQCLEWTSLHREYSALVELRMEVRASLVERCTCAEMRQPRCRTSLVSGHVALR